MKFIKLNYLKTFTAFFAAIILFAACKKNTPATPGQTLDELINTKSELSIFAEAIKKARLDIFTKGGGPFTVFAPTNDAFKAAGINTAADLSLVDSNLLVQVLTYHIQATSRTYPEIPLGPNATMSTQGGYTQYASRYVGGSAYINGAKIISEDIKASNGILYVINKVLIPPFNSALVNLSTNTDYSLMYQAILKAGISSTFTASPVTVLAISNADMTAAGYTSAAIAALTGTALTTLTNTLKYHVIPQRVFSPDFISGNLKTALGTNVIVSVTGTSVTIKGANNTSAFALLPFDLVSSNGLIQGINGVLKP